MTRTAMLAALAVAVAAPALAQATPERPPEATIPFVDNGSVRNFQPVGDDVIYLQDRRRNWYRAELNGPCLNLQSAVRIAVDTRFGSTLDRTGSFLVDGQRCPIFSLVRSGPPPRRQR